MKYCNIKVKKITCIGFQSTYKISQHFPPIRYPCSSGISNRRKMLWNYWSG